MSCSGGKVAGATTAERRTRIPAGRTPRSERRRRQGLIAILLRNGSVGFETRRMRRRWRRTLRCRSRSRCRAGETSRALPKGRPRRNTDGKAGNGLAGRTTGTALGREHCSPAEAATDRRAEIVLGEATRGEASGARSQIERWRLSRFMMRTVSSGTTERGAAWSRRHGRGGRNSGPSPRWQGQASGTASAGNDRGRGRR